MASCFLWSGPACTRSVSPAVNKVSRTRETRAQQRRSPQASTSARRPSFEVVAGGLIELPKSHPGCPSCGAIGSVHSIHRACQIRFGIAEDPAESIGDRSGIGGPHSTTSAVDVGAELKRMQVVIDDLLRERSQWKSSRPVGSMGVVEGTMIQWVWGHSWTIAPRVWKP